MGRKTHLYQTAEQLQDAIDEYFIREATFASVTGLCLHLGFSSKSTFYYMCEPDPPGLDPEKSAMREVYRTARLRIEHAYEKRLIDAKNPTGAIFALKNMGWTDKQEIEQRVNVVNIPPIQWVK